MTIEQAKRVHALAQETLDRQPDYRAGECDGCHDDSSPLWLDADTEGAGDFTYCRACWEARGRRAAATCRNSPRMRRFVP